MTKLSKAHPHTDCAPVARADMILNEITQFVIQHPRKEPEIDPWEQALRSAVIANPRSPYALHDWAAYMGDKEMRGAHKALRQFRRNAHHRGKNFFQSLRTWLLTPFRTSSPQPTEGSARRHLPHFPSDPPWDQDKAMSMMNDLLRPQEGFKWATPHGSNFAKSSSSPKRKPPDHTRYPRTCCNGSPRNSNGIFIKPSSTYRGQGKSHHIGCKLGSPFYTRRATRRLP